MHAPRQELPWPVILLSTRYSHKHIFASNRLPKIETVSEDIETYINTIKWRWVNRNLPKHNFKKSAKKKVNQDHSQSTLSSMLRYGFGAHS